MEKIVKARIHPAIGIARVGNSDTDFFCGPEVPYVVTREPGFYRDAKGRLKRQAARFRIYGLDAHDNVVSELTSKSAEITWTVHVVNSKGAWFKFEGALDLNEEPNPTRRRNEYLKGDERKGLVIDPGPQQITGSKESKAVPLSGRFLGEEVHLGELRCDEEGRLLFLGGLGKSRSPEGRPLQHFANNEGWYDDTSDGSVCATVRLSGTEIPVECAWVVCGPPDFAPGLVASQPMYDVMCEAQPDGVRPGTAKTSFTRHILPLFLQLSEGQWVNESFLKRFGWKGSTDFADPEFLRKLAADPATSAYDELRLSIFRRFRSPENPKAKVDTSQLPPIYGDAIEISKTPTSDVAFSITRTAYNHLRNWSEGRFQPDYDPKRQILKRLEEYPIAVQPETLDEAALHFCIGGPFHPGCEITWPMRHTSMYRTTGSPFRLNRRTKPEGEYPDVLTQEVAHAPDGPLTASSPGDLTRWLAVPWQGDTATCGFALHENEYPADEFLPTFWPSRVPNQVISEADFQGAIDTKATAEERQKHFRTRQGWIRWLDLPQPHNGYLELCTRMVDRFQEVGVLERRETASDGLLPDEMHVESLPSPVNKTPGDDPQRITSSTTSARQPLRKKK